MRLDSNTYILLKFNKELVHSKNLANNGGIWFSKISDWANIKENGDKFETIVSYKNIEPEMVLKIFNDDKQTNIAITKGKIISTNENIGYASSFYLLNLKDYNINENFKLPTHMHTYGKTCVMILNPAEFIDQCKKYFDSISCPILYQKVNYNLAPTFENRDVFTKHEKFNVENEFRFYIPLEKIETQLFSIGSLKSYSIVLKDFTIPALKFAPASLYPDIKPKMFV